MLALNISSLITFLPKIFFFINVRIHEGYHLLKAKHPIWSHQLRNILGKLANLNEFWICFLCSVCTQPFFSLYSTIRIFKFTSCNYWASVCRNVVTCYYNISLIYMNSIINLEEIIISHINCSKGNILLRLMHSSSRREMTYQMYVPRYQTNRLRTSLMSYSIKYNISYFNYAE